ncbi:ParB/RepB/Spo0J family partition protein [Succinatimonas hippei]|uniref:ParB/RepB/Spo0J family partition protein n=1 Tax=Succinatimonas hippei TaxID=626938 RepID=UPI0026ECF4F4|nr:ParB/RepB/Spo0J family partition protein [Succinatimonas hippei]
MAGLGRGLNALLSESKARAQREENILLSQQREFKTELKNTVLNLKLENLIPSPYQPRQNFDSEALNELALSIKEHGLLEPLLVKSKEDGKYEIICGERRYRAAKIAGLTEVPCLVRDVLEKNAYAIALIENIQRKDLNPLEQASALLQMMKECSLTQEELAKTLGKSRSSVTNILRLNQLSENVKKLLLDGSIEMGHAKAILSLDSELQEKAAKIVVSKGLNVRQTEAFIKELKDESEQDSGTTKIKFEKSAMFKDWEKALNSSLQGALVKFTPQSNEKGKVVLSYKNKEQLEAIIKLLGV